MARTQFGTKKAEDEAGSVAEFFVPSPSFSFRPNSAVHSASRILQYLFGKPLGNWERIANPKYLRTKGKEDLAKAIDEREMLRDLLKFKKVDDLKAALISQDSGAVKNVKKVVDTLTTGPFK